MKGRSSTNPIKKEVVKSLLKKIEDSPIIGILNLESMPSAQLNQMRKNLRSDVEIITAKKSLIKRAIDTSKKKDIKNLEKELVGMPAILLTKTNPFQLFKTIKKNQTPALAKAGQVAPNDITLKAGPTDFPPGPIISEFGALGVKTGVENGKVAVKEDKTLVKKGEVISDKMASTLGKLGMKPMLIGLDLLAVYENGEILPKSALDLDEDKFKEELITAHLSAYHLALEITYITKETLPELIVRSERQARQVAKEGGIITKENIGELLATAELQMNSVKDASSL